MNNKIELRYTLIISILAILLSIFSFNIPLLGLLIPCLYAVLSTTNSKSILIVLAINFLVVFNVDSKELVKFFMLNILPGITVGIFVKRQTYDKNTDNNGYLEVSKEALVFQSPSDETTLLYQFNKRKMESFIYDMESWYYL